MLPLCVIQDNLRTWIFTLSLLYLHILDFFFFFCLLAFVYGLEKCSTTMSIKRTKGILSIQVVRVFKEIYCNSPQLSPGGLKSVVFLKWGIVQTRGSDVSPCCNHSRKQLGYSSQQGLFFRLCHLCTELQLVLKILNVKTAGFHLNCTIELYFFYSFFFF